MRKRLLLLAVLLAAVLVSGCASVKMADSSMDAEAKRFAAPAADESFLYIYRTACVGSGSKMSIWIDGKHYGDLICNTFSKKSVTPGRHVISTESEFSPNHILVDARGGEDYYILQIIRPGVFLNGANLRLVSKEEGRQKILSYSKLTQPEEGKKGDLTNIEQLRMELKPAEPKPYTPASESAPEVQ